MTTVSYDDFAKLDLRVAKIISTESIEGKSRIIKGKIDLGGDDQRDVIIGGAQYFQPDEIIGKTVIEARKDNESMRSLLKDENLNDEELDSLSDSSAIEGVKKFPVRIKCALLSWSALTDILSKY